MLPFMKLSVWHVKCLFSCRCIHICLSSCMLGRQDCYQRGTATLDEFHCQRGAFDVPVISVVCCQWGDGWFLLHSSVFGRECRLLAISAVGSDTSVTWNIQRNILIWSTCLLSQWNIEHCCSFDGVGKLLNSISDARTHVYKNVEVL